MGYVPTQFRSLQRPGAGKSVLDGLERERGVGVVAATKRWYFICASDVFCLPTSAPMNKVLSANSLMEKAGNILQTPLEAKYLPSPEGAWIAARHVRTTGGVAVSTTTTSSARAT